jgi:DNA-directed RNA polymerase subunit K/omega
VIVGRWIVLDDGRRARVLAHQFVVVSTNQLLNQHKHVSCALIEFEDGTISTGSIEGCKLEALP